MHGSSSGSPPAQDILGTRIKSPQKAQDRKMQSKAPTQPNQVSASVTMPPSWRFLHPLKSGKCRVVFAGPHFQAGLASTKALLQRSQDLRNGIELMHAPTKAELVAAASTAAIAMPFMEHFDRDFIRAAPRLRLIQQFGVGLERVDMEEATNQGVAVSNVPAIGSGNVR